MLSLVLLATLLDPPVEFKLPVPELKDVTEWVNSKPLKFAELKGKVVVVHFFAFA